jgi:hypothetical protein
MEKSPGRRKTDAAARAEFDELRALVERHTKELEIQFQRIAQLQSELDYLRAKIKT